MEEYQAPLGDVFDVPGPKVGEILQRARTEKGLALSEIARISRIPLRHLTAIEADAHESLPALPYALGFVKTFARMVGLDPAAIATQFRTETSKTDHIPQMVLPIESLDEKRMPSPGVVVGSALATLAVIAVIWAYGAGYIDPMPTAATPPAPPVAEPEQALPAPVAALPEAPLAATPADPAGMSPDGTTVPTDPALAADPAAAAPITGSVVITATDDAWFKVYSGTDGTTVKMGILRAGESFAVPGDRPGLKLWTGKAGALRIAVGSRTLAPLGAPDQMVKDVSLDAADLLARGG